MDSLEKRIAELERQIDALKRWDAPDYVPLTDYSASSTVVGWAATPTVSIEYSVIGKICFIYYIIFGTSNATSTTFTVPFASSLNVRSPVWAYDNGINLTTPGRALITSASSTVTAYSNYATASWTASGAKLIAGNFFYPL